MDRTSATSSAVNGPSANGQLGRRRARGRRRLAGAGVLAGLVVVAVACYQVTGDDVQVGPVWDPFGQLYEVVFQPAASQAMQRDREACHDDTACLQEELLQHWDTEVLGADRALFVDSVTHRSGDLVHALDELARVGDGCIVLQRRVRFGTSLANPPSTPAWRFVPPGRPSHCGSAGAPDSTGTTTTTGASPG